MTHTHTHTLLLVQFMLPIQTEVRKVLHTGEPVVLHVGVCERGVFNSRSSNRILYHVRQYVCVCVSVIDSIEDEIRWMDVVQYDVVFG